MRYTVQDELDNHNVITRKTIDIDKILSNTLTEKSEKFWSVHDTKHGSGSATALDMAQKIFKEVHGVTMVEIRRYSIAIEKGAMFRWEDITKNVIIILHRERDTDGELINTHPHYD